MPYQLNKAASQSILKALEAAFIFRAIPAVTPPAVRHAEIERFVYFDKALTCAEAALDWVQEPSEGKEAGLRLRLILEYLAGARGKGANLSKLARSKFTVEFLMGVEDSQAFCWPALTPVAHGEWVSTVRNYCVHHGYVPYFNTHLDGSSVHAFSSDAHYAIPRIPSKEANEILAKDMAEVANTAKQMFREKFYSDTETQSCSAALLGPTTVALIAWDEASEEGSPSLKCLAYDWSSRTVRVQPLTSDTSVTSIPYRALKKQLEAKTLAELVADRIKSQLFD